MTALLEIDDLHTHFPTRAGVVKAVDGVSLTLARGQVLGLVGESGSGKSMLGCSVMGLIEKPGRIAAGRIVFDGQDLTRLDAEALRRIRGKRIAMIFQDPMMTLNPVLRVGVQMEEAIHAHERASPRQARQRCIEALAKVGIPSPEERLQAYPHEFSGGMRQRVAIATALLHRPDLIVADEPTTALDVTIQAQILAEISRLVRDSGTALIWITHDLSIVSRLADEVAVMYAGRIVERGPVAELIEQPLHPYTAGLIASVPSSNRRGQPLAQIPGTTPNPLHLPAGCAFRARCARADEACRHTPAESDNGRRAYRCFHPLMALAAAPAARLGSPA
ncbi:MAG: ABC transporter ATP-binding protein [Rubrivivax sp.]